MSFSLTSFDLPILSFLTSFAGRSVLFDTLVELLARYAAFKGALLFSLLWLLWFRQTPGAATEQQKQRRQTLIVVFFVTIAAVCLARLLQRYLWVHPRPFHMNLGLHFPDCVNPLAFHAWNSFPSDHAVYFFSLATGLIAIDRRIGLAAFLWTAVVICLPRVYLGIHHPSDIVGGCAIGVVFMLSALRLSFLRVLAGKVLNWGDAHPGAFYCLAFLMTVNAATLFDDFRAMVQGLHNYLAG